MKLHLIPVLMLAAAMLPVPLPAEAAETQQITLTPPADVADFLPIGELHLCFDTPMNGSLFEVYLVSPEGDLPYYRYPVYTFGSTNVCCPLMRDGIYRLTVTIPQADFPDCRTESYTFQMQDPDPPDRIPEFDFAIYTFRFFVTSTPDSSDNFTSKELVTKDRVYSSQTDCTYARKSFSFGDVNEDGDVNAKDAAVVLSVSAAASQERRLSSLQAAQADMNGDRIVNAKDAAMILSYSASASGGTPLEYIRRFLNTVS